MNINVDEYVGLDIDGYLFDGHDPTSDKNVRFRVKLEDAARLYSALKNHQPVSMGIDGSMVVHENVPEGWL